MASVHPLRMYEAAGPCHPEMSGSQIIWVILAVASMVVGSLGAIAQSNIKATDGL